MTTINQVIKNVKDNNHVITEIVEHNGKTFRIISNIRNGGKTLTASLMNSDGVFEFVLGINDVNFEFTASYVGEPTKVNLDLNRGIEELKKVIKKVYK